MEKSIIPTKQETIYWNFYELRLLKFTIKFKLMNLQYYLETVNSKSNVDVPRRINLILVQTFRIVE